MEDCWRPKRLGPASDRDNITRQTLRDTCVPHLPRNHIWASGHGGTWQQHRHATKSGTQLDDLRMLTVCSLAATSCQCLWPSRQRQCMLPRLRKGRNKSRVDPRSRRTNIHTRKHKQKQKAASEGYRIKHGMVWYGGMWYSRQVPLRWYASL